MKLRPAYPSNDPLEQRVFSSASSARFLGGFFVLLGGLPLLLAILGAGGYSLTQQILAIIDTAILLGPGIWYFIASFFIRRFDSRAVRVSIIVGISQFLLVIMLLVVMNVLGGF